MQYLRIYALGARDIELLPAGKTVETLPLEDAAALYRVERNDGTPIGLVGYTRPFALDTAHVVWFVPYTTMRAIDYRGLCKLFPAFRSVSPTLFATIEAGDTRALRFATHCGFKPHETGTELQVMKWQLQDH